MVNYYTHIHTQCSLRKFVTINWNAGITEDASHYWRNDFICCRAFTTFKLEGEVTSLSESSQGELEDFWQKLTAINRNNVLWPLWSYLEGKTLTTRYDYNLTIMKSPKPATDTIYPHIKFWWYRTMLNFYPPFLCRVLAAILKMAHILKSLIAPLMVTYHYVKIYVSIIIQLKVININVRNFKFPIGFYSNPHPLWTPKNMALTTFTTNLKTLGSTRNIYL